jgi:hypothetical protein
MIIAEAKKRENIAEYVLYMYQVEDIIRAFKFDMSLIEKHIVNQYKLNDEIKEKIKSWYQSLIDLMVYEQIEEKGHLSFLQDTVTVLRELHEKIINDKLDENYIQTYQAIKPLIDEFRNKLVIEEKDKNDDITVCFHALYAKLLMKLQKKPINESTEKAFSSFSKLISLLASHYHKDKGQTSKKP